MTREEAVRFLTRHPEKFGRMIGFTKLGDLHGKWIRDMVTGKEDKLLQAHRGSYKTTAVGVALTIQLMLRGGENCMFIRKTDDDVKEGRRHEDGICLVHFGVDIHEPSKSTQTCFGHNGFDIPLRSLVPLGVENLLTAGRCISGSFVAHAAYRVTGDCLKMGEAAGVMAAVAAAREVSVRHLARKDLSIVMESINKGGKI